MAVMNLPKYPVKKVDYGAPASSETINAPLRDIDDNLEALDAKLQQVELAANTGYLDQAYCLTDDLANTESLNCTVDVHNGKTRVVTTYTYASNTYPGEAEGDIRVELNGAVLYRVASVGQAFYTEVDANTVELDSDYSAFNYTLSVKRTVGTIDSSDTNSTAIANNTNSITELQPFTLNTILNYLIKASVDSDLNGPLQLIQAYNDQYFNQDGIDLTNSVNHFFLQGSKKFVNDGIGGFNTVLYTGDGNAGHSITGVGFQPDFVWIKERDATGAHIITDAIRGVGKYITFNFTDAEATDLNQITSFDSDGFTLGTSGSVNQSSLAHVAWCFECPTVASFPGSGPGSDPDNEQYNLKIGMSIVKYTGTGTAHAINHNLGAAPQFMIVKELVSTGVRNWQIYHPSLHISGGSPNDGTAAQMVLHFTTAVQEDNVLMWNDTAPISTTFSVGTAETNNSGATYIGYLFSEIPGFSKFDSYEGNGGSNSVTGLGFRPEMLIIKNIDSAASWLIYDDTRDADDFLQPHSTNTEETIGDRNVRMTNDGFDITGASGESNFNGDTYIYAAFGKKGPAKDIDLISEVITATVTPGEASVYSLFTPTDSVALNTDLKLYISRVDGAESQDTSADDSSGNPYWVETLVSQLVNVSGNINLLTGTADLSVQSVGTALRYRWVGFNTKKMEFRGTYMSYK